MSSVMIEVCIIYVNAKKTRWEQADCFIKKK